MDNLTQAVKDGDVEKVRLLIGSVVNLSKKNRFKQTLLHYALERNNLEIVKLLIKLGCNIFEKDIDGWTPLHEASYFCHLEITKLLIESGSNILEKDNYGLTALHIASQHGNDSKSIEIVKLLVQYYIKINADLNIKDYHGKTAIDLAGTKEIKDFLIQQLEIQQNTYVLK